jgi:hypothetical protein
MPFRNAFLTLLGPALFLSACMSPQQRVQSKEDLLAAAGFIARPANTPEREAMLRSLPPNQLVQQAHGDQFVYVFADPLVCKCVFTGDPSAYSRYRLLEQRINEQLVAVQMNEDVVWNWGDWGPTW